MRTTCIFLGMLVLCIAFLIFMHTEKGKKWMDEFDK